MKKMLLLVFLVPLCLTSVFAQTIQIRGQVVDSTSAGIPNVSVVVTQTKKGVSTDKDGNFSLTVTGRSSATLQFTYVGYRTQTITTNGSTPLTVVLSKDQATAADEVVVIGYQTVRRRDVLASVSSVSAKDLKDIPINSAAEALNGRLAGVTATTSEGSPDAQVTVRVRGGMSITGDNSPLYIVDGVQVENGLSTISPQDIQSIDVLKDAAATAIYGARGANGVIVITTKSGKPGRLVVSYNGYVGVKTLPKTLGVLSPYDFVIYQSERSRGSSTDSTNFTKNFGTTWDTLNVYKNTDAINFQKQVLGNTGFTQTHNITAAGGSKKLTYSFGYTYNDDKAIVINSNYKRHLLNFKGDYKITKKLRAGISTRLTHQDVFGAGVSSDQGTSYSRLRNAVKFRPFLSNNQLIDENDPIADPNPGNGLYLVNPIALANAEYRKRSTDAYNVTANIAYDIFKNLTFRSTFGYDVNRVIDRQFSDSITPYSIISGGSKPIAGLDTTLRKVITNSNVFTYSVKGFRSKHNFDFLLGEETYDLRNSEQTRLYKNFPLYTSSTDAFKNTGLGSSFTNYPKNSQARYTSLSFFGRINYSYKDKYLFSANVREDGASKFMPGKQWGTFPAFSVAWRVNKEKFMENVNFINDLKFRAGFGTVGNNRIKDYLYLTTFSQSAYYYGLNGQSVSAYTSSSLPNEDLQWESTVNRNYGVDVSILKSRINFSLDYYNNTSSHLLLDVPIASTYGYTTQTQNIGQTSNKGVEFQINAIVIRKPKNFSWTANFNISHNQNKVLQLGVGQQYYYPAASWGVAGQPTDYIVKVGEPVGSMYGLITDGFYTTNDFNYNNATGIYTLKPGTVSDTAIIGTVTPGSIRYKDLNGDGKIDLVNDRTIIGNPTPKFTGGLNQQFTYKQWDASIFVNFSYGGDIYNANKIEFTNGYTNNANLLDIMQNRWKTVTATGQTAEWVSGSGSNAVVHGIAPDQLAALNANATIWRPLVSQGAFVPHSWAIEDGSFLRVNNVTIGYTFAPKSVTKVISKLRLYFTGNNLAIITKYTGYDPEVSVRSNPTTPNLDYSAYPKSRSFIFGVNATF